MGADRNKVFLPLAGKPILVRSVEACLRARGVSEVLLVAHPQEIEEVCALVHTFHLTRIRDVIAGRRDTPQSIARSTHCGRALKPAPCGWCSSTMPPVPLRARPISRG
jgi:2-C-methyl-D-erythritol 4-phosphate cytidylyltransferase